MTTTLVGADFPDPQRPNSGYSVSMNANTADELRRASHHFGTAAADFAGGTYGAAAGCAAFGAFQFVQSAHVPPNTIRMVKNDIDYLEDATEMFHRASGLWASPPAPEDVEAAKQRALDLLRKLHDDQ